MTRQLPLGSLRRVNVLCDKFEDSLLAGESPRIEQVLEDQIEPERSATLRELLRLELYYKRQNGDLPIRESYLRRFPHAREIVVQAFHENSEESLSETVGFDSADAATEKHTELEAFVGRYAVEELLGSGAFGSVYLAHEPNKSRPVAIKVLHREKLESPAAVRSFFDEARNLSALAHPAVAKVDEIGKCDDGRPFVVMEYVKGYSLKQSLDGKWLERHEGVELVARVAEAISYVHRQGIYHRDLKPANIIIGLDGGPRVVDFGLALHESVQRSKAGEFAGTTAYMSPEQVRGEVHHLDGRADIWALGVILYEVLTGRKPFGGDTREQLAREILDRDPRPPRQILGDQVSPRLEEVCLKALSKKPSNRYATADDLAADLREALDDQTVTAESINRERRKTRRGRAEVMLAEHARHWAEKPERRRLPNPAEFVAIRILTAKKSWTDTEARLMRAAAKHLACFTLLLFALVASIAIVIHQINKTADTRHMHELVVQLGEADVNRVPAIVEAMEPYQPQIRPLLEESFFRAQADNDHLRAVRYSVPLLPDDHTKQRYLCERLLAADGNEMAEFRKLVLDRKLLEPSEVRDILWREVERLPMRSGGVHHLWPTAESVIVRKIEDSHGRVEDRFAFCQTLAIDDLVSVCESLRSARYRPHRIRPYVDHGVVRIAAIWHRDNAEWQMKHGLTRQELLSVDGKVRGQGFLPIDACAYLFARDGGEQEIRYSAIWMRRPNNAGGYRLLAGIEIEAYNAEVARLKQEAYIPLSFSSTVDHRGRQLVCAVWVPADKQDRSSPRFVFNEVHPDYFADVQGLAEVTVCDAIELKTNLQRYSQQLALAEGVLDNQPNEMAATFIQGRAYYYLKHDEEAVASLSRVIDRSPEYRSYAFPLRALAYARLGDSRSAEKDLAAFQEMLIERGARTEWRNAYLACLKAKSSAFSGSDEDAMKPLEELVAAYGSEPTVLFYAACAYSAAYAHRCDSGTVVSDRYATRALHLLQQATTEGLAASRLLVTEDLEPVHRFPEFVALVRSHTAAPHYSGFWIQDGAASRFCEALSPLKHIAKCDQLCNEGYLPSSIDAVQTSVSAKPNVSSVWRQYPWREDDERQLGRATNAAAGLLRFDRDERILPLLLACDRPGLRSNLIHRLSVVGVDPNLLIEELTTVTDASLRQALLLALADYSQNEIRPDLRDRFDADLLQIYRQDPDAGVRAAASHLLRAWGQPDAVTDPDRTLLQQQPEGANWYVNLAGHSMVIVPAPGEFAMGSPSVEADRSRAEEQHCERIDRAFAISATEVTVAQIKRFKPEFVVPEIRGVAGVDLDVAAHGVNWFLATAYCNWLSQQEGIPPEHWCYLPNEQGQYAPGMKIAPRSLERRGYRLPTEAEWEYACRAGTRSRWYHGESEQLLSRYCWHLGNSAGQPQPVGLLEPNLLGLFDMSGNVLEWTHDRWRNLPNEPVTTSGQIEGSEKMVARGGSYGLDTIHTRSAARLPIPANRRLQLGFRVARTSK